MVKDTKWWSEMWNGGAANSVLGGTVICQQGEQERDEGWSLWCACVKNQWGGDVASKFSLPSTWLSESQMSTFLIVPLDFPHGFPVIVSGCFVGVKIAGLGGDSPCFEFSVNLPIGLGFLISICTNGGHSCKCTCLCSSRRHLYSLMFPSAASWNICRW